MVMVIDDAALRVVSALVGMYDVMEHRVTLIAGAPAMWSGWAHLPGAEWV